MKEIIPFTMALNTEETPMGAGAQRSQDPEPHYADDNHSRQADRSLTAAVKDLPIFDNQL